MVLLSAAGTYGQYARRNGLTFANAYSCTQLHRNGCKDNKYDTSIIHVIGFVQKQRGNWSAKALLFRIYS